MPSDPYVSPDDIGLPAAEASRMRDDREREDKEDLARGTFLSPIKVIVEIHVEPGALLVPRGISQDEFESALTASIQKEHDGGPYTTVRVERIRTNA